MNTERLFAEFERLSDAPDAVSRFRHFILAAASRGRLVPQDPSDALASTLLEPHDFAPAEAQAVRVRDTNHAPFEIPASWAWTRLTDVLQYDAGVKRDASELRPDAWLVELEDIEKDTGRLLQRILVRDRLSLSTKSEFIAGDVLYGKLRPYLNKVVVATEPGYSTTEIVALRPRIPLCPDYACIALRRSDVVAAVDRLGQGTKMPRLKRSDAQSLALPLPPLAEQHRIVAKVDELMALCDELEHEKAEREQRRARLAAASLRALDTADAVDRRDRVPLGLRGLSRSLGTADLCDAAREAIRALAVRGLLVAPGPSDVDVESLLRHADTRRAKTATGDRRADPRSQDLLADEYRWTIPEHWTWRGLADLVLFIDYRGKTPAKTNSGVRLITAKNVRRGVIALEPEEFISADEYHRWMTRGIPAVGDVLFTTEAPMGNASVVRLKDRFALAQRVIDFRPYGAIDPDYLVLHLLSPPFKAILGHVATGLTAKGIKAAKLKRLPVAVPPLGEQHRIVSKVGKLMAICDELERSLAAVETRRARALEAVLAEVLEEAGQPGQLDLSAA